MNSIKMPSKYRQMEEEEIEYDGGSKFGQVMAGLLACAVVAYAGYSLISGLTSAITTAGQAAINATKLGAMGPATIDFKAPLSDIRTDINNGFDFDFNMKDL